METRILKNRSAPAATVVPILIYEDVGLVPEAANAIRVFAWPLFVDGADGSPVTFVAELPDRA